MRVLSGNDGPMEFERTRGPIGDPFLDTVHRRHPDVDIVVLPDPRVAGGRRAARAAGRCRHCAGQRADAAARLTALWRTLHEDPARGRPVPGRCPARAGSDAGTLVPTAEATTTVDPDGHDGRRMLSRLAGGLDGWQVQRLPGPVERLVATRDGASLRASYAGPTGVLVVVLTGPPLGVGGGAAHDLVRGD